jgi:hypothetical protein
VGVKQEEDGETEMKPKRETRTKVKKEIKEEEIDD